MVRWRNVFIALIASAWAHGLAAAILHSAGFVYIGGFCVVAGALSVIALVPVGSAANDQEENWYLKRVEMAESEARRLRAELAERVLKEEG